MRKVVLIHGGAAFDSYEDYFSNLKQKELHIERLNQKDWKESLAVKLGEGFEVIQPRMPCKENAKYAEWKIWFEKCIPHLCDGVILVGHSLGGIFLAKYLSEEKVPIKIAATILAAAPYDSATEETLGDFALIKPLSLFAEQGGEIILFQSEDDPVVPYENALGYAKELPNAILQTFPDRHHFIQEDFPELISAIKS